jgi:hypothetical protein
LEDVQVNHHRQEPLADVTAELDNVLRLRLAQREPPPVEQRNRHRRLGRDWADALEAVQMASTQMAETEQRARDIEARGLALADRALKELKAAELRVQSAEDAQRAAEARAIEAEARAQDAEARAQEAEGWLTRLNQAIHDRLLPRQGDARRGSAAA